jgi:replicative superfamily II helicase
MLGRAGRPQFDTSGIARIFTQDSKKAFYSKNCVPLTTTRCAGRLTPQASVLVATRTWILLLAMSEDDLELNLARVKDDALREALNFGIGLHHAGLVGAGRLTPQASVLVATRTWILLLANSSSAS